MNAGPAFMLINDGECDQICGTRAEAEREKRDLKNLGCGNVRIKEFPTWAEAEAFEDKLRERF
jgi:hypothetical protein